MEDILKWKEYWESHLKDGTIVLSENQLSGNFRSEMTGDNVLIRTGETYREVQIFITLKDNISYSCFVKNIPGRPKFK